MLPLGRIATVRLPDQHQELFASAAQLPLKLEPFSPHLYEIWLAGVGRVLSGMLQASQPARKRAKTWRVFNTSELFQAWSGEKNGYFIFSTSKLEGKERKRKIKELTEFLIYIKSNGREDLIAITHLELS